MAVYTAILLKLLILYFNVTASFPLKGGAHNFNSDCTYLTDYSGAVDTESVLLIMSATEGTLRKVLHS